MQRIIAAIDESAAAHPTLATARLLAELFDAEVVAIHVTQGTPSQTVVASAASAGVPLEVHTGDPIAEIARVSSNADTSALVLGSRRLPASHHLVGTTALALIESVAVPVVVVPPQAHELSLHRLLVPLEGTEGTTAAVEQFLGALRSSASVEALALHVFDATTTPAFSDRAGHETRAWTEEFARRWASGIDVPVVAETRVGQAATVICDAAKEIDADAVVVGWKQDFSPERADVVRALLMLDVPVILVPLRS
jgi:nucleotide-binding universal stress UspA family protein